jgi:hypothetical protein
MGMVVSKTWGLHSTECSDQLWFFQVHLAFLYCSLWCVEDVFVRFQFRVTTARTRIAGFVVIQFMLNIFIAVSCFTFLR